MAITSTVTLMPRIHSRIRSRGCCLMILCNSLKGFYFDNLLLFTWAISFNNSLTQYYAHDHHILLAMMIQGISTPLEVTEFISLNAFKSRLRSFQMTSINHTFLIIYPVNVEFWFSNEWNFCRLLSRTPLKKTFLFLMGPFWINKGKKERNEVAWGSVSC